MVRMASIVSIVVGIDDTICVVGIGNIGISKMAIDIGLVRSVYELACVVLKGSGPGSMGAGIVGATHSNMGIVVGIVRDNSVIGMLRGLKGKREGMGSSDGAGKGKCMGAVCVVVVISDCMATIVEKENSSSSLSSLSSSLVVFSRVPLFTSIRSVLPPSTSTVMVIWDGRPIS